MKRSLPCALAVLLALACARRAHADPPDPVDPLLHRMESYLHREEVDGITRDARYALNPTETIRLSIVSQLLAFNDLSEYKPHGPHEADVRERADFLIAHLAEIRSNTPFDGMLGYAMLGAYELTGDPRYFAAGERITWDVMRYSGFQNTLNWGLMAAMSTAKYYDLTGTETARAKTQEIVESLRSYQHADGSFPHYCPGSTDIHYTGWMGMELIHVRRYVPSATLDDVLARIAGFLSSRIGAEGRTSYETLCTVTPFCSRYYYSQASGCSFDYDTRAWVNELGYTGLVLDAAAAATEAESELASTAGGHEKSRTPQERAVMRFLDDLEDHGAVDDKWDYPPAVLDPLYPWATGHPSVIRTSVVFWSLATEYFERRLQGGKHKGRDDKPRPEPLARQAAPDAPEPAGHERWRSFQWNTVDRLVLEGADPGAACAGEREAERPRSRGFDSRGASGMADGAGILGVEPRGGGVAIRFAAAQAAHVSLEVFDLSGRRVVAIDLGNRGAGEYEVNWDGRDAGGAARRAGVYFARLRYAPGGVSTARFALVP